MPTYRLPVVYWKSTKGVVTGTLLEKGHYAVDYSASGVLDQLRALALSGLKELPMEWTSNISQVRLGSHKVQVLPEYREKGRLYPAQTPLELRIPIVTASASWGSKVCFLPTLNQSFYYFEDEELKNLVPQRALSSLRGSTPALLHPMLEPLELTLDEVQVKLPPARKRDTVKVTPKTLSVCSVPLSGPDVRGSFQRAWGMEQVVAQVCSDLQDERRCLLLVGRTGSGKTTVLRNAIQKLGQQTASESFPPEEQEEDAAAHERQTFWQTTGANLIAGMQYLGQWQQRLENVIRELSMVRGTLVLERLSEFLNATGEGEGGGLGGFILPYLQNGELRVVAESTPEELSACRQRNPAIVDVFQCVYLPAHLSPGLQDTILSRVAAAAAGQSPLTVQTAAMPQVLRLFSQFQPYHAFPGAAASFVRELVKAEVKAGTTELTHEHVLRAYARKTGVPETLLNDALPLPFEEVVATLSRRVIGQTEAVETAARTITRLKAGIHDPERPLGVLLFCGPTGVGKTELAKAMAELLFGAGEKRPQFIRLDMSEYQGPLGGERLISRPDGTPSPFIQQIRQNPFAVVLLDELEKASAEVFDVLMGVFDEGRLTDRAGRLTHFQSTLILMTSNLGATRSSSFGFGAAPPVSYQAEALRFFRPEFVNRMDRIVPFQPLGQAEIEQITRLELDKLAQREGLELRRIRLEPSPELIAQLAQVGFHPRYGARPLQRAVERAVVVPLARALIAHPQLRDVVLSLSLGTDGSCVVEQAS